MNSWLVLHPHTGSAWSAVHITHKKHLLAGIWPVGWSMKLEICGPPPRCFQGHVAELLSLNLNLINIHSLIGLVLQWPNFFLFSYFQHLILFLESTNYVNQVNECSIGDTSRETFEIPARLLNITIYHILCQRWFEELLQFRLILELFQL